MCRVQHMGRDVRFHLRVTHRFFVVKKMDRQSTDNNRDNKSERLLNWALLPFRLGLYAVIPTNAHKSSLTPAQVYWGQTIQIGLISGALYGAQRGGYQRGLAFLAENSQRLPKTKGGFYFFQKERQTQMLKAGVERGALYGLRFGLFMSLFGMGEYFMESYGGKEAWYNPIAGGALTSLGASIYCESLSECHGCDHSSDPRFARSFTLQSFCTSPLALHSCIRNDWNSPRHICLF